MTPHETAARNTFLAALPARDSARLVSLGEMVHVAAGDVLYESGRLIRFIWFPLDCVCSLATCMENGSEAEVAVIGREGVVGPAALPGGSDTTWNEATVQIGGDILRVPFERLNEEASRSAAVRLLLQRFTQALLVQTSQTAACNRFHSIEQRMGRFLLALTDRVPGDDIAITHERLAVVLGSLRPGVTLAAGRLQEQGIIRTTRGRIHLLDRARLKEIACECYEAVASEYDRLLGAAALHELDAIGETSDDALRDLNSRLLLTVLREHEAREDAELARDDAEAFARESGRREHEVATLLDSFAEEVRVPLRSIFETATLLIAGNVDPAVLQPIVATLRHDIAAQQQLGNQMLTLAALRCGEIAVTPHPLDLHDALRSAVAACRPSADVRSIAVTSIVGAPVSICADALHLTQILDILLSMALRSAPERGAVEVLTSMVDGDAVQITIAGAKRGGDGSRRLTLAAIGDEARPHDLGHRLRLAIARQLVLLHGGTLDVQETPGSGVVISLTLPRSSEPAGTLLNRGAATRRLRSGTPARRAPRQTSRSRGQ